MDRDNAQILLIECTASKRLIRYVWFLHTIVLQAIIFNGLALIVKLILGLLVLVHLKFALRPSQNSTVIIRYTESTGWGFLVDNVFKPIDVLKSTVITTQVVFLHFNDKSQPQGLTWQRKSVFLLLSDRLSEPDYRHLVVKLRMTVIK